MAEVNIQEKFFSHVPTSYKTNCDLDDLNNKKYNNKFLSSLIFQFTITENKIEAVLQNYTNIYFLVNNRTFVKH